MILGMRTRCFTKRGPEVDFRMTMRKDLDAE